jgi:hypothetical protein
MWPLLEGRDSKTASSISLSRRKKINSSLSEAAKARLVASRNAECSRMKCFY